MYKIFLDSEFTGFSKDSTLISIGLVTEDNIGFYAEFTDYDKMQIDDWLQTNVLNNLIGDKLIKQRTQRHKELDEKRFGSESMSFPKDLFSFEDYGCQNEHSEMIVAPSSVIKQVLKNWFESLPFIKKLVDSKRMSGNPYFPMEDHVQIWSDVLAWDWVLFNDLLAEYDSGFPMIPQYIHYIPIDVSSVMVAKGIDPDIDREKYVGVEKKFKHNALWDANVIKKCSEKLALIKPCACEVGVK